MAITVREALKIGRLSEAQVLAGSAGLDREIRAVDIIDVPDAAIWFQQDSLLSTTFYALKDNIDAQLKMLDDIHACGGAGLIIFSPERYITHIDQRLIQKADQISLPLLQMPDCSYIDVIVPIMSQILDKQVKALEYAREVHSMMTQMVLRGKSLQELLSSMASLLNKPILMADAELLLQHAALPPGASCSAPLAMQWQKNVTPLLLEDFYPRKLLKKMVQDKKPAYCHYSSADRMMHDFFFPIIAGDNFYGALIVPNLEDELDKEKTTTLEAGAIAIALDTLKEKAIREAEHKSERDFYNELLLGNLKSRDNITSQARQYGLDASGSYYVMLTEINKEELYRDKTAVSSPVLNKDSIERKLHRLLNYALEKVGATGTVIDTLGSIVTLIRLPEKQKMEPAHAYGKDLMLKLRGYLSEHMPDLPLYMAVGDYCADIERINTGYMEAWETIDLGKKIYKTDFALSYSDMAPYHLVKRFLATTGSAELYERILAPLLHYDRQKGGELAKTLETYLECNFSRTRTAERLHLHRNSLNYRLQKIEELLGRELDSLDPFPILLASISRRING